MPPPVDDTTQHDEPVMLCGDGTRDLGELCDDGNVLGSDGCSPTCVVEGGWRCDGECEWLAVCGDGILSRGEQCEPSTGLAGCSAECRVESGWRCPSGLTCERDRDPSLDGGLNGSEACNQTDAGPDSDERCSSGAALPRCGDGIPQQGEQCDNGVNADLRAERPPACAPGCVLPAFCGDGIVDGEYGEECDLYGEFNLGEYGTCSTACTLASRCGDGVLDAGYEVCDDGNRINYDGCDFDCQGTIRTLPAH